MKYSFPLLIVVLELGQCTFGVWDNSGRCPPVPFPNGKVRTRGRGKIIRFQCFEGFTLIGNKYSTCVRGNWDTPTPICVNSRCSTLATPKHALVASKYNGAILMYFCAPGYILIGSHEIYCNGRQWNGTVPYCRDTTAAAPRKCDFEKPDLCWWEQDPKHDFDWRRHNFETPSSHIGTGPTYDHTFGPGNDGYYLYIEASGRLVNDSARIISPLYNASLTYSGCFSFWYHMYGATIGTLRIYFKTQSNPDNGKVMFERQGNQGNKWHYGVFNLPKTNSSFQIIIEGIRGGSYVSDLAIDDVAILEGEECTGMQEKNSSTTVRIVTEQDDQIEIINALQSCRGRCDNMTSVNIWTTIIPLTSPDACHCSIDCAENSTCCPDFAEYCVLAITDSTLLSFTTRNVDGNKYQDILTPEEPKDELEPYTTKIKKSTYPPVKRSSHLETPFVPFNVTHYDTTTESHVLAKHVQMQATVSLGLSEIISIVVVLMVLGTIGAIAMTIFLRRRKSYERRVKSSKSTTLSEDSDVRFLTSDEILDFNLARPNESNDL